MRKPPRKALEDPWEQLCEGLPERLWRTPGAEPWDSFPKHLVESSRFRFFNFRNPLEKASCCQKLAMDRIHFNFGNYTWFTALCAVIARLKNQVLSLKGGPEIPRTPSSQCCLRATQAYRAWRRGSQHCNGGLQRGGDPEIAHARRSYIWPVFECGRRKCRRLEKRL